MKKRILAILLIILICLPSLTLFVSASEEIQENYTYQGTLYYDAADPYHSVYGNTSYAYQCYIATDYQRPYEPILFLYNGRIVRDETTNERLLKMYFAQTNERNEDFQQTLEQANAYIALAGWIKANGLLTDIAGAASQSLGAIGAVYLGGGTVTLDYLAGLIATKTVSELTSHFIDIATILSELQLNYLYYTALEMEYSLGQLNSITDLTAYTNCEKYFEHVMKLDRLKARAKELVIAITEDLKKTDTFGEVLGKFLLDAGKGFVGEFAVYIISYDKFLAEQSKNPLYFAKIIEWTAKLSACNQKWDDVAKVIEGMTKAIADHFCLAKAYYAYKDEITPLDLLKAVNGIALGEHPLPEKSDDTDTPKNQFSVSETEFAQAIATLREEYPHGKYWNNYNGKIETGALKGTSKVGDKKCKCTVSCPKDCSCSCGTLRIDGSTVAWQCHGYALLLAYKIFGSNINASSDWEKITSLKSYGFYAGDVVRTKAGHTLFVYKVENGKVYYTDCNAKGPCQINWNGEYTVSQLRSKSVYVRHLKGNTLKGSESEKEFCKLTIHYDANGGTIPTAEAIGSIYKVTTSAGLNVRASAGTSSTKLGTIAKGTSVTVTEQKASGGYTWGKITYQGKTGWIALEDSWVTQTSTAWSQQYCVSGSLIYKTSSAALHTHVCTYGTVVENGLYNNTTFGLYRDGYIFKGWSLSSTGGKVIDHSKSFLPEELVPELENGNQTITVYAVWEQFSPEITAPSVERIYISAIPQKSLYYVGDTIDISAIRILVMHTNGSLEEISEGFTCTPQVLSLEGNQAITIQYEGATAYFDVQVTAPKDRTSNATATKDAVGYLLPSTSAPTLKNQGVWKNDSLQVLCRDGDFFLCFVPWGATSATKSNGVLLYIKTENIELSTIVPDASEYYSLNENGESNAVILADSTIYYRPDGGATAVKFNGEKIAEQTISCDTPVRVLFEIDGHYCIQTAACTGFISKSSVALYPTAYMLNTNISTVELRPGEGLSLDGLQVEALLTDESHCSISDYAISLPYTDTAGEKYAIISYGDLATYIKISVFDPAITGISIDRLPAKLFYSLGAPLDTTGIRLTLLYENGSTLDISNDVEYYYDLSEPGTIPITVQYGDHTAHFTVTVYEKPEIEVLSAEGFVGQSISIPILYFSADHHMAPTAITMTVSYDANTLKYIGLNSSELNDVKQLMVEAVDEDTLQITYSGTDPLSPACLLTSLGFKIKVSYEQSDSEMVGVTIDSVLLQDSLGNAFDTFQTDGCVVNMGQISISYVTNSSESDFSATKTVYGAETRIPSEIPTMEGYTFAGWSTAENAEEAEYEAGDAITCTEDTYLYAVWISDFDTDNSTGQGPDQDYDEDGAAHGSANPEYNTPLDMNGWHAYIEQYAPLLYVGGISFVLLIGGIFCIWLFIKSRC